MIGGESVLAVITARGGSKGLPGKNIRALAGQPLIAWTIAAAKASRCIDRLVLSSDDETIITVARSHGCEVPFVRPGRLATDAAGTVDVVLDALQRLPAYDWVVVLQPTSPLRLADDIDSCLAACITHGASVGVSVCEASMSPYWMFARDAHGHLQTLLPLPEGVTRRQDLPPAYQLNGAVYVARSRWLADHRTFLSEQTYAYVMPQQRSIDIDDELDFRLAELVLSAPPQDQTSQPAS